MPRFEYKVVPAPKKPGKIKGVKGTGNKFAVELSNLMNQFGADGWEYQRTDTLPCEERQGFTGRTTTFQNMLVFRREINVVEEPVAQLEHFPEPQPVAAAEPEVIPTFTPAAREPLPTPEPANTAPENLAPENPQLAVPTFRSAAIAGAPRLTVSSDVPEGKAPPIAAQ